jgi:Lsr2 protein
MGTFLARYVMTRLVDDLDGSEAVTTLSFSLDGLSYEIDLSEPHLVAFRQAMAPFVTAARKVPDGRRVHETAAAPTRVAARTPAPIRNGHATAAQDAIVAERGAEASTDASTLRPAAVVSPAFQQPDHGRRSSGAPARSKPERAPLVADPFNPQAHRA